MRCYCPGFGECSREHESANANHCKATGYKYGEGSTIGMYHCMSEEDG